MARHKSTDVDPDEPLPDDGQAGDDLAAADEAADEGDVFEIDSTQSLQSELDRADDRVLRLQAEMENLRGRTSREIGDVRRYASLPLLRDLLPVVDNVERAIQAAQSARDAESLVEGFELVAQQLATVLAAHQCTTIDALGQPFDPNLHEAISQQPSAEHPKGTVILVTQTGYQLHDRVVRPAQVIISTEPTTD